MEGKRGSILIFHIYFGSEDNTRSLNHRRITKSVFDQRPEDTHSSLQNRYVLVYCIWFTSFKLKKSI